MKTVYAILLLLLPLSFSACLKGESGPAGPMGPRGETGQQGLPGRDGASARGPIFSGFYRIFLQGDDPEKSQTFVDSSQYLFFGQNLNFKLYKQEGDSCRLRNQGTADWGANSAGSIFVFNDSDRTYPYQYYGQSLKRTSEQDLLGCGKCELRAALPCDIR